MRAIAHQTQRIDNPLEQIGLVIIVNTVDFQWFSWESLVLLDIPQTDSFVGILAGLMEGRWWWRFRVERSSGSHSSLFTLLGDTDFQKNRDEFSVSFCWKIAFWKGCIAIFDPRWVQMIPNELRWFLVSLDDPRWAQMIPDAGRWSQMSSDDPRWSQMLLQNSGNCFWKHCRDPKRLGRRAGELNPYSRFSRIEETNLDVFLARAFFNFQGSDLQTTESCSCIFWFVFDKFVDP